VLDYWLWRRERRIHAAAAFWAATLLAPPGILIAGHFLPLVYNTIAARGDRHVAAGPFREGTPVRLSVYAGRIGYRVIERVRPAD
jgi:hypothetical protein